MEKARNNADIIIVGSGAAGMMAAIAAGRKGKKCLILEKGSHIAVSNAARAGGPALANTLLQKKANAVVTEFQLFEHMYCFSRGTVNAGLLRNAISKGAAVEECFRSVGIEMEFLPDTYGVGFRARQMFRCSGKKRWQPLYEFLIQLGGSVHFDREAFKLLKQNGRVYGVEARDAKRKYLSVSGGYRDCRNRWISGKSGNDTGTFWRNSCIAVRKQTL